MPMASPVAGDHTPTHRSRMTAEFFFVASPYRRGATAKKSPHRLQAREPQLTAALTRSRPTRAWTSVLVIDRARRAAWTWERSPAWSRHVAIGKEARLEPAGMTF